MKTKYERMSREEKKELFNKYKLEKKDIVKKMNNMFMLCILGVVCSIVSFIYDYFNNSSIVFDVVLFVFCIIVYIRIIFLKKKLLNEYCLKNK